jgi:hypothetical protein
MSDKDKTEPADSVTQNETGSHSQEKRSTPPPPSVNGMHRAEPSEPPPDLKSTTSTKAVDHKTPLPPSRQNRGDLNDNGGAADTPSLSPGDQPARKGTPPAPSEQGQKQSAGLEGRGAKTSEGERSLTRDQYRAQDSNRRARETCAQIDQPLENPEPDASEVGHLHSRHGYEVTDAQQQDRVRTGITPDGKQLVAGKSSSRFSSAEAEAEAVGRGERELQEKLARGDVKGFDGKLVSDEGKPARTRVEVVTKRAGGFGTRYDAQVDNAGMKSLDAAGQHIPKAAEGPLNRAVILYEYVPSSQEWRPFSAMLDRKDHT